MPLLPVLFFLFLSLSSSVSAELQVTAGELTPLQKHVTFFDRDHDGIIYVPETFQGLRAIGCSVVVSGPSAALIHAFISPKTLPSGTKPSLRLPIYIENIKKGIHGSDSGSYDSEGRFVPEKFEEIFKKHAHTNPNALTSAEVDEMLKANHNDTEGGTASSAEWKLLFSVAKDKDGLLQKERLRGVFDGTLFYQLEKENSQK